MKPLPQRKSPRLQGYDYSSAGAYFVTICTYERYLWFGDVIGDDMQRSKLGDLARWHWYDLPNHFPHVILDGFVVMPNHVHGILFIIDELPTADTIDGVPTVRNVGTASMPSANQAKKKPKLGTIVGTYKAAVTRQARKTLQITDTIWQSRYHDHIIRDEKTLTTIRQYVMSNPAKWAEDVFYQETI